MGFGQDWVTSNLECGLRVLAGIAGLVHELHGWGSLAFCMYKRGMEE